jgi:acetolactate synthase-1/2/3 large subunit
MSAGGRPIHPLRLCREIRDFLPRDAVLCVDGQEILNYARSAIPFYAPHSLNSGPYGCMGVGLPFGLGAKAAMPVCSSTWYLDMFATTCPTLAS